MTYSDSGLKYSDFMAHESVEGRTLCPIWSANIKLFLKLDLTANAKSLVKKES